ncbi:MAG: cytochrome c [Saprospiraceae bacterium]|nr:cytochrome c [Saprospiraceae bacterium]MBK7095173.1 cytochrome c [Saprospiraceae bacterium]
MELLKNYFLMLLLITIIGFSACQKSGVNNPGSEYMPEMYHSTAYEANYATYYPRNQWVSETDYMKYAMPRQPVEGTISRDNSISDTQPFYYGNTDAERTRAMKEIVKSPFEFTDADIQEGKNLYTIYCAICHGDKGDGKGYLVRDNGGKFPALPANFMSDDLKNSTDGRYYYALMHGIRLMNPFNDKLNYKERWQVIRYIRTLQK